MMQGRTYINSVTQRPWRTQIVSDARMKQRNEDNIRKYYMRGTCTCVFNVDSNFTIQTGEKLNLFKDLSKTYIYFIIFE